MTQLTENATRVLEKRYLIRDAVGKITETPDQMFRRVAAHIASAEIKDHDMWEERYYNMMGDLAFLPNSPCLMSAGKPNGMLSACFVMPLKDSLDDIFHTLHQAMLVQARGGGVGYSLSHLRPNGDIVASTGHATSGPISFLRVFDSAMEVVKQGGARHGANMATMSVSHPDIEQFIDCKQSEGAIKNFNISVCITDEFMDAVVHNKEFNLINPRNGQKSRSINARSLWRKIAEGAWRNGEPGIIMIDEVNRHNSIPSLRIDATNPCGELPLPAHDSCNLGSINLNSALVAEVNGTHKYVIDMEKLRQTTRWSVRFLDNVIAVNNYPIPEITETTSKSRRIGLGIMGLADVLLLMHLRYDSDEGREMAISIMKCINDEAHAYSQELAEERGPFPLCSISTYRDHPHRNATLTTIAPTGTISMLADCSSGCEPHFAVVHEKHVLDGQKLIEINPAFKRLAKENGFWTEDMPRQVAENGGTVRKLKTVPEWAQNLVRLSSDMFAIDHVKMQAALQLHVDNSISKTINATNDITVNEVEQVFMAAHDLGCRGLTFYREGSRKDAVLVKPKVDEKALEMVRATGKMPQRAKRMEGATYKIRTGYGALYVTVNKDEKGLPSEVFVATNDVGGELRCWTEFASRITSYALRLGLPIDLLIKAGKSIRGPKPIIVDGDVITSGPNAVAKALEMELKQVVEVKTAHDTICPECHGDMTREEGCQKCHSCGFTVCGG
jgi:ribonucleoside-diphosphate reductase alpha chain